ncbi:uncharacterized protein TRUGW13939_08899 [Talaromyces rugulosus]|uniref:Protein BNI4 n=1 Tax=Talaromyces rugulosus TaxID=121627 RepID=A0A7H8RB39_TALRU|nr:uncharacterized protein TRUGW13939_08899 [Talaromyces rugulosus]QKX61743.1 hypothetical protein TRUGW13939_08899 [Talaromyces rugulosus]
MAALVQTIPQQNGTVTLLQTRPSSASGHSSFVSASQVSQPQFNRGHAMSFSSYNGVNTSGPNRASVAPYAFTSTPGLVAAAGNAPQRQPQTYASAVTQNGAPQHLSHFAAGSVSSSSTSSNSSSRPSYISQDDSILSSRRRQADTAPRPLSTVNLPSQSPFLNLSSPATTKTTKPSPDRYRRGKRSQDTNTAQPAVAIPTRSSSYDPAAATTISQPSRPTIAGHVRVPSADDTRVEKPTNPDIANRYRRRSWASIDAAGAHAQEPPSPSFFSPLPELKFDNEPTRPASSYSQRNTSSESVHSDHKGSAGTSHNPSPLSNQMIPETPTSPALKTSPEIAHSPAAQRLADISKMSGKKPGKSRLRRAFSFGSAAELRKVSAQNSMGSHIDQDPTGEELDPEQAAIAARQEANGLGNSIYTHQLGSTDNLSISSTASSASIMLRKMGRGMKKSTRSLVGLFRPKSISNMQTDSVTVEPTAQVSVVNIEAERKTVVANPDPHDQSGGGTVFPKIQATKIQAPLVSEPASNDGNNSRKSILGGERERAEVLAAVKKGILKRSGSSSPVVRPTEPTRPYTGDSPNSSAPSTPDEQSHRIGHRRTDTVKIEGEDYFLQPGKLNPDSKSAPGTPQPVVSRSIVFSPRIQFHETWPSGEYDRRGEIATCNKLTPLLAQQIKEELNTFKMEMEVHETSKVYTHFL